MTVALIAAVAGNGVIGADNAMPWRLSTDLQRFKRLTLGKPVVMGRRTFESLGKPLAGRLNIVITRQPDFAPEGVSVAASLDTGLALADREAGPSGEVMVIGGGQLYAEAIGRADRLYITHVDAAPEGDTHFPSIDPAVWRAASREAVPAGEKDSAATEFVVYRRIGR
jgi:dihydrofolate reductase